MQHRWIIHNFAVYNIFLTFVCPTPPFIYWHPARRVYFQSYTNVYLRCFARGNPKPVVSWMKNNNFITTNVSARVHVDDGTLKINSATGDHDEGVYVCIAVNNQGTARSDYIQLILYRLQYYGAKHSFETFRVGEPATFKCNEVISAPAPRYFWAISDGYSITPVDLWNRRINESDRIMMDNSTGILYYANVETNDSLPYHQSHKRPALSCFAVNADYANQIGRGTLIVLNVTDNKPEERPPKRKLPEKERNTILGHLGKPLVLKCFFFGFPTPIIEWETELKDHMSIRFSGTELYIKEIEWSDDRCHTCIAHNELGIDSAEICVTVVSHPKFVKEYKVGQNVTEGQNTFFSCEAEARPKPTITWSFNNIPINSEDPGIRRTVSKDGTTLIVISVCKQCRRPDTGVYACNVSNSVGYIFRSEYLNILEPTKITEKPSDVALVGNEEVSFFCTGTIDPNTHLVQLWSHHDSLIREIDDPRYEINDNTLRIKVSDISDDELGNYLGEYKCILNNGYSTDTASAILSLKSNSNSGIARYSVVGHQSDTNISNFIVQQIHLPQLP